MMAKKVILYFFILLCWTASFSAYAEGTPVIQINGSFRNPAINGKPTLLLILRNEESGIVIPYLYQFSQPEVSWSAFAPGQVYRVAAAELSFDAHTKISNFCGLQDGILANQSMWVTLSGTFSPYSIICHVTKYRQ